MRALCLDSTWGTDKGRTACRQSQFAKAEKCIVIWETSTRKGKDIGLRLYIAPHTIYARPVTASSVP